MPEPKEQQQIEDTGTKPTRRVKDAARKYARALYQRMQLQEDEAVLKPALDKVMDEDGNDKLEVSFTVGEETIRYEVKRKPIAATAQIKCKKLGDDSE